MRQEHRWSLRERREEAKQARRDAREAQAWAVEQAKIKAQAEDPTEAKLIGRLGGYVQVYGNMAASIIQQRSRERAQKAKEEEAETERDLREMLVGLDPTVEGEDGTKASAPAAAALPAKPSTRADKDLEAGGGLSA